jgi:3-hydroxyisobutyrate dehydrogenase-like beta-hydroxyacid dehydrogenase
MRIGWIGVGVMGTRMVQRLIQAGHQLTLFNRSKKTLNTFKNQATLANSLDEITSNQDIIITMVGFPHDVKEIYDTLLKHVQPSTILIDMTTSSPVLAQFIYKQAQLKGVSFLDAPVTGGDIGAKEGTLTIMVGGEEKRFIQLKPIFDILGKNLVYMGGSGNGMKAKLANQIAIAATITGLAESLHFAQQQELDLNQVLSILNLGAAQSFQSVIQGPKMIAGNVAAGFYIKHFQKDLSLALETSKTPLPMTYQAKSLYDWMVKKGYQDLGTQAVIEYFKNLSWSK